MNEDHDLDVLFGAAQARPRAPLGFADRVLARVALEPRVAPAFAPAFVPAVAPESTWTFWLRAAAHPAVALAFALAGVVVAWPAAMAGGAAALLTGTGALVAQGSLALLRAAYAALPALRDPLVAGVLLALAVAPLAWVAALCARVAERWTRRLAMPAT